MAILDCSTIAGPTAIRCGAELIYCDGQLQRGTVRSVTSIPDDACLWFCPGGTGYISCAPIEPIVSLGCTAAFVMVQDSTYSLHYKDRVGIFDPISPVGMTGPGNQIITVPFNFAANPPTNVNCKNLWNSSTNSYTVQQSGIYTITVTLSTMSNVSALQSVEIFTNPSMAVVAFTSQTSTANYTESMTVTFLGYLSASEMVCVTFAVLLPNATDFATVGIRNLSIQEL